MGIPIDWAGVLTGPPAQWLVSGLVVTLAVTLAGGVLASLWAVGITALRLAPWAGVRLVTQGFVGLFRNTPLLVQLLLWYFVGFAILPADLRRWLLDGPGWGVLPGNVSVFSPEFLAAAWGLGVFSGVFLAEELQAGLNAVAPGQREAAAAQGLGSWDTLSSILLPQALANAFQPLVGQYLNLMKLTSIACSIGLAELTYQARQIESFNSHAFEAFAAGTLLYLAVGFVLERLLTAGRRT